MALLSIPHQKKPEDQQQVIFAESRALVAKLAYEKWVVPYFQEGKWIYHADIDESEGRWIPHLQKLAEEGKHEEAVREVWDGAEGDWFDIFEGELHKVTP